MNATPPEAKPEDSRGPRLSKAAPLISRTVLAGGAVGGLLLIVAEFTPLYREESAASRVPLHTIRAGSHHGYALIPVGVLAVVLAVGFARGWRAGSGRAGAAGRTEAAGRTAAAGRAAAAGGWRAAAAGGWRAEAAGGWRAGAAGGRAALVALGALGVAAALVAVLGDLPDAQASGFARVAALGFVKAKDVPAIGLYLETLGAALLVIVSVAGLLLTSPSSARSARSPQVGTGLSAP